MTTSLRYPTLDTARGSSGAGIVTECEGRRRVEASGRLGGWPGGDRRPSILPETVAARCSEGRVMQLYFELLEGPGHRPERHFPLPLGRTLVIGREPFPGVPLPDGPPDIAVP